MTDHVDPARTLSDDGARKKNLFSKDERMHLLSIMIKYAPLLDDKSTSVFDRREIWRAIERDFHQAGFTGKSSVQLKKYWQNYKYHGRRAQAGVRKYANSIPREEMAEALHPQVPESNLEVTRITKESAAPRVSPHRDVPLRNVVAESGCRQRQIYRDNGTFFRKLSATPILPTDLNSMEREKNRFDSETSQRKRSSGQVYEESKSTGVIDRKPEKPIGTDVIVSNTDVSNNSVTVSVIYPERTAVEPLSRNQTKRKREGDISLDRFPFQSSLMPAASPGKKHRDNDHSIFPGTASATKGRCFLLQPRHADNRGEVISDKENAAEVCRKLESAKNESIVSTSKFTSWNEISCSARKIRSEEDIPREDFAGAAAAAVGVTAVSPRVQDNRGSTCRSGKSHEESRIREDPANSRNQRDESNHETTNDAAEPRTPLGNAGLWGRDMADSVQWELRNYELSHRLMLHRLETEEKRLKVKIAEMAIQEIRFRIQALNEDIRRADELHELHLALATAQAVSRVGSANTILQKRIHRDTVIRSQWLH